MTDRSITVIGAGNIGSHLIPHLARMPGICRVIIVDRDTYQESNLMGQEITAADIGMGKARAQARRLRRIRPDLEVRALAGEIADLPPGLIRSDLLLACLDSRAARQDVNELAWTLGVPWIDSGVNATGMLAQVHVYVPTPESPCLECAWDDRDYDLIEQAYPCGGAHETPSTNAPSFLGSLAASLLAIEAAKILGGSRDEAAPGRAILYDAMHHKLHTPLYRRNPHCRFHHRPAAAVETVARPMESLSLDELIHVARGPQPDPPSEIEFIGRRFLISFRCIACGTIHPTLRLIGRGSGPTRRCNLCGGRAQALAIDRRPRLEIAALTGRVLARTLRGIGARAGDIARIRGDHGERLLQITSGRCD